jgi:hypothetical protein
MAQQTTRLGNHIHFSRDVNNVRISSSTRFSQVITYPNDSSPDTNML